MSYVVSFFIVGITWVNHHALVDTFVKVDRKLLFLNLLLLLFVVAIPFATSTMATYLRSGGNDAHVAAALYGVVLEGMGVSFGMIFVWSLRRDRRVVPLPPEGIRAAVLRFGLGSIAYLVAIAVAFVERAGIAGDHRAGRRLLHLRADADDVTPSGDDRFEGAC